MRLLDLFCGAGGAAMSYLIADNRESFLIACNHDGSRIKYIPPGAKAFVRYGNPGGGHDRIPVIVRTRSGRWVSKWERIDRLYNFRATWVWDDHPVWSFYPASFKSREAAEPFLKALTK